MPRTLTLTFALLVLGALAPPPAAAKPKPPKYYLTFRETLEAPGLTTGLKDKVKPLLYEELRKYPEFVLELPDAPQDPAALAKYFKKKKLKGYEVNIRLTKLKQTTIPPKPGERHKTLSVTVAATIFGTSFPDKSFAIGGDGESTVEIPVRTETPRDVEAAKNDALKDAIQQAVVKTLRSLEVGMKPPTPEKRKKK
ncbi:MAG TPA: hypothetical protein VGQ83_38085 [Polyangia bacterium]|jgi:hypothetical protein